MADNLSLSLGRKTGLSFVILLLVAVFPVANLGGGGAGASITCPPKQFVKVITALSAGCGFAEAQLTEQGNVTIPLSAGALYNQSIVTFPAPFPLSPNVTVSLAEDSQLCCTEYHISGSVNMVGVANAPAVWSAMPAATTEIFGTIYHRAHFVENTCFMGSQATCGVQTVTLFVNVVVVGSAGSKLELQYNNSTVANVSTGWVDPCNGYADVPITAVGLQVGQPCSGAPFFPPWQAYQMRVVGKNGNGVASPSFGMITAEIDNIVVPHAEALVDVGGPGATTPTQFIASIRTSYATQLGGAIYTVTWTATECILATLSAC